MFKKAITTLLSLATVCVIATGCGPSAPQGNDQEVKDLVIEIAKKETLRQMFDMTALRGLTLAQIEAQAQNDKTAREVLNALKTQLGKIKFDVVNVRVDSIDEKVGKSSNSADLQISMDGKNNKYPITYTAQCTEDGRVYVEVSGLQ